MYFEPSLCDLFSSYFTIATYSSLNLFVGVQIGRTTFESVQFLIVEIFDGLCRRFQHAVLLALVVEARTGGAAVRGVRDERSLVVSPTT